MGKFVNYPLNGVPRMATGGQPPVNFSRANQNYRQTQNQLGVHAPHQEPDVLSYLDAPQKWAMGKLTGREQTPSDYIDAQKRQPGSFFHGMDYLSPSLTNAVGVAGNIALDPINLIPFGKAGMLAKGIKTLATTTRQARQVKLLSGGIKAMQGLDKVNIGQNIYQGLTKPAMAAGGTTPSGAAGAIGAIGGAGAGIISGLEGDHPTEWGGVGEGALSGAGTGAAIGSVIPGIGTAIGAVAGGLIGGIGGFFSGRSKQRAADSAYQNAQQQKAMAAQNAKLASSQASLQNFPTQGVAYAPFMMGEGGYITPATYKAEGDEVIEHHPMDTPKTDSRGSLTHLSHNTSLINGDSHQAKSGGVGMSNELPARIYSDQLEVSPHLLKRLNHF